MEDAKDAVLQDLRFEYMVGKADDGLWDFVCEVHLGKDEDNHVSAFVEKHAREPMDLVCYLPIQSLGVAGRPAFSAFGCCRPTTRVFRSPTAARRSRRG